MFNSFHFRLVHYMSIILTILLLAGNFYYSKIDFFLLLNYDGGIITDYFFEIVTYVGDGLIWIPFLIYILIKHRSFLLATILSSHLHISKSAHPPHCAIELESLGHRPAE